MTGSPALNVDGVAYAGSDDNVFYAITSTGDLEWSYRTARDISSSPAIDVADSIYVGSEDERFYVFNSIGALEWSYRTGDAVESSPAIATDGSVYIGSNDDNIYVFTSWDTLSWSYRTGGDLQSSPAIDVSGEAYIGSFDNRLYAYNSVGALSWSYLTDGDIQSSPMVDASGYAYVGSDDNNLYTCTSGGALEWSYNFPVSTPSPFGIASTLNPIIVAFRGDHVIVRWWCGWPFYRRWDECEFHTTPAGARIRYGYISMREIRLHTDVSEFIIRPVEDQVIGDCLWCEWNPVLRGGDVAIAPNRRVIAADDRNLIYSLVDPTPVP
jgi:outer membrane protein assembly factor BamB